MYYAGIDAHAQYLQVVVLDKHGAMVAEGKVTTKEPAAVTVFLRAYRPLQVVVESCSFWPWLRDALEGDGVTFHLAHARELRAIAQHAQKNDAVAARLLARMLLAGLIPPAYAHSAESLESLRLVRHYAWLTRYRQPGADSVWAKDEEPIAHESLHDLLSGPEMLTLDSDSAEKSCEEIRDGVRELQLR